MDLRSAVLDMRPVEGRTAVRCLAALAVLATVAVLWLGLSRIDATSMWLDETFSVVDAQRSLTDMLAMRSDRGTSVHPPLYSMVLGSTLSVCGVNETCARLPSVLGAAAACGLMVMLAGRVFGWVAAGTAAWLWPTMPYLLKYADQARGYTLLLMFSVIAMLCAGRVLGAWGAPKWRRAAIVGLALSVTAMVALHLLAATFVLPLAGVLWVLTRGRDDDAKRALKQAVLLAAVLILPLAVVVVTSVVGDDSSRFASSAGSAKGLKRMAHALVTLSEYTNTVPLLMGAALLLTPGRRRGLIALGLLLVALPIAPLLVRAPAHFIVLRYFMPSLAVVGLLACAGIAAIVAAPGRLPTRWTKRVPLPLLLVLAFGLGAVPSRVMAQRHTKKLRKRAKGKSFEPWNAASAWAQARTEPGAAVVLVPHAILWPTLRVYPVDADVLADDPEALLHHLRENRPPVVFVMWSHVSTRERQRALRAVMQTMGRGRYKPTANKSFGRRAIIVKEYRPR